MVYAEWLQKRIAEQNANVWLLNTGWTGGPYGTGHRFSLNWTRTFVDRILDGSLSGVETRHASDLRAPHARRGRGRAERGA